MASRIQCKRPIVVKGDGIPTTVKCGRCSPCRLRHKMAWTGRLLLETETYPNSRVLNLTYRDPDKQTARLDYRDIQLFLKKRRLIVPGLRFFCCGEYGSRSGHAHWHIALFNDPSEQTLEQQAQEQAAHVEVPGWTDEHGYATDMALNPRTAAYICGYTLKKGKNDKPFMRLSLKPSIGFPGIERIAQAIAAQANGRTLTTPTWINTHGKKYPLADGAKRHLAKRLVHHGVHLVESTTPLQRKHSTAVYMRSKEYLARQKLRDKIAREERIAFNAPTLPKENKI